MDVAPWMDWMGLLQLYLRVYLYGANDTNLLERKGDTPLLLRPGVKIEDNRFLLLFTPVLCASTQYLMFINISFI